MNESLIQYLQVVTISQDSFYRELTAAEKAKAFQGLYNFDHPDAFDEQLMYDTLEAILKGVKVEIPGYDYKTNSLYVLHWTGTGGWEEIILCIYLSEITKTN